MKKNHNRCLDCGHISTKHNAKGKCLVRNCKCKGFKIKK